MPFVLVLCGKINTRMERKNISTINTPRIIPTLVAGFNTVAANILLILIPVGLDLLYWFGPHLRLKTLLEPMITSVNRDMLLINPDISETVKLAQILWDSILTQYNLTTSLSSFPVGVPSLITYLSPLKTPVGNAQIIELTSANTAILAWAAFVLAGLLIGCLYFNFLSRATAEKKIEFSWKAFLQQYIQTISIALLAFALILIITIPLTMLLSFVSALTGNGIQIALLVIGFMLIWLLLPLVFSPHGIFVLGQKAITSTIFSVRMVRSYLPGTGLFVFTAVILNEGLRMLWQIPPENSWMLLVGVFGHAFIVTSVLASSFLYYRSGVRMVQANLQQASQPSAAA